ncbi:MAG: GAF domain-containing protein [Anaerolineae bacterium]|nr:GAF domain-containing protein [Anaerolineae bacterium]
MALLPLIGDLAVTPDPDFDALLGEVQAIIEAPASTLDAKLLTICQLLRDNVAHYDWVGFYLVDPEAARELVLGPYAGAPTEHTRIPFGRGICGQAAATERTFIVQDVAAEENYLSCSPDVRSEIVLPILQGNRILGELDIDSHKLAPFTEADQRFLGTICELVAPLL